MQNSMTLLSAAEREARVRRSAIMAALYSIAVLCVAILGIWMLVSLGSSLGFYASLAAGAALTDPLRRNLTEIFD